MTADGALAASVHVELEAVQHKARPERGGIRFYLREAIPNIAMALPFDRAMSFSSDSLFALVRTGRTDPGAKIPTRHAAAVPGLDVIKRLLVLGRICILAVDHREFVVGRLL